MYTDFYGFSGFPFQLTPDYRFFFDSKPHRKAMAYLTYGLSKGEGFIVITGEVGAGKTTMIDYMLSSLAGKNIITARIVTTQIQANDLLRMVASAFGITQARTSKASLLNQLDEFLVANHRAGKRAFLVIDEVQSLANSSLEELRMLSNFGMGQQPVLQICLVGQPEFRRTLASQKLEQLRQRIIASHHLVPLDAEETHAYIEHRLRRVDWHGDPSFTGDVFDKVYADTGGVPRKINSLCDRLLLLGYLEEKHQLTGNDVDEVLIDMRQEAVPPPLRREPEAPARHRPPCSPKAATVPPVTSDDIGGLHQRIANLERLLTAALMQPPPQPASAPDNEPPPAAPPAEPPSASPDLDKLLHRLSSLEQQLKGEQE